MNVSADDLALVLYFPESVNYGEPDEHGRFPNATCLACGRWAGAHYCVPRENARNRLWQLLEEHQVEMRVREDNMSKDELIQRLAKMLDETPGVQWHREHDKNHDLYLKAHKKP